MAICRGCGRPALPRNGLQRLGAPLPVLFLAASVDAQTDANKHTAPAMASCARPSDDTDGLLNALHLWEAGQLEQSRDVLLGLMGEEPVSGAVFLLLDCVLCERPALTPKPSREHGICTSNALHRRCKMAPAGATRGSLATLEATSPPSPHNLFLQGYIHLVHFLNQAAAVQLFQEPVAQGLAIAQSCLAFCFEFGKGVEQNSGQAVRLYKLAADRGYTEAQNNLARCYEEGNGVEKDLEETVRLYRLAADQGFAPAQKILGFLFRKGTGVDQNLQEAVRMYRLAAIQGYAGAQKNLAFCYQYGEGVEQDLNEALRLYRLAADRGHAAAQQGLGFCYHQGMGVKKDLTQAARLYKLAADQGDAGAQAMMSDPEIARAFAETPWSRREPLEFGARAEETMIATLCSAKRRGLRLPVEMWELVFSFMNREDFGVKAQ
eukprot:m.243425 g.243425  ORF g.243425 m.243425 type:complete len:435 (+) comp10949_c2_seq6:667-1971(+)